MWTLGGAMWLIPDSGVHLSLRSVNEEGALGDRVENGVGVEKSRGPAEAAAVNSQSFHIREERSWAAVS